MCMSLKQKSNMALLRKGVKRMVYLGLSGYIVAFLFITCFWKGVTHTTTISKTEKASLTKMHRVDGQRLTRDPQRLVYAENKKAAIPSPGVTPRQLHATFAPVNVDLALRHGPPRPQPAHNMTQGQLQYNRNVVVEKALPGRFTGGESARALFVEGGLEFEDLQVNEDHAPEGDLPVGRDLGFFEKINSRVRNQASMSHSDNGGNLTDDGREIAVYDGKSLPKQGRVNKDSWISPDGVADSARSSELHSPRLVSEGSVQLSGMRSRSSTNVIMNISVSKAVADFKAISDVTIYSAFFDDRAPARYVRMMAIAPVTRRPSPFDLWCLFPMAEGVEPTLLVSKQTSDCIRPKKNCYHILSCQVPSRVPFSGTQLARDNILVVGGKKENNFLILNGEKVHLTLTASQISAANSSADHVKRRSYQRQNEKSLFSVCVPPESLSGKISAHQLVEFVELNRLFSAAHFTFYEFRASREIARVLRFYEKLGLASVLPWNLPAPNDIWNKGEAVAMGDCLYRNMHLFNYVAFLRVNEFIVPHQYDTWDELFRHVHLESENLSSIAVVYRLFPRFCYPAETRSNCLPNGKVAQCSVDPNGQGTQIPLFVTLRKTLCSGSDESLNQTSIIVRPDRVVEVEADNMVKLAPESNVSFKVAPELASLYQYRAQSCEQTFSAALSDRLCGSLVLNRNLARFEKELVGRTKRIFRDLNRLV